MSWSPRAGSLLEGHSVDFQENPQTPTASSTPSSGLTISRPVVEQRNTLVCYDGNNESQEVSKKRRTNKSGAPRKTYTISGKPQTWNADGPLYLRQSDNRLVHLHCCVMGCDRAHFTTITSLMTHVSSRKNHGFGRGFFKGHSDAVEKCGRLPVGHDNERFLRIQPKETGTRVTSTPEVSTTDLVFTSASEKSVVTDASSSQLRLSGVFGKIYEQENDSPTSDRRVSTNIGTEDEIAYSTGIGLLTLGREPKIEYTLLANEKAASDLSANKHSTPTTIVTENLDPIDVQNPNVNRESSIDYPSDELFSAARKIERIACSHDFSHKTTIKGEPIDDRFPITTPEQLSTHKKAFSGTHASRKALSSDTAAPAAESESPMSVNAQEDEHNDPARCKRALSQPLCSSEKRTKRHSRASTDNCSFFWQFY